MGRKSVILFLNLCFVSFSFGKKPDLPSFMKICHRSDPNLVHCIRDSVEGLKPYIMKGIPELGIPSCEPLIVPEIELDQGTGPVCLKSKYTNITVYGASNFKLLNLKIDLEKNRAKFKIFLPHLHMISNYKLNGKVLMMPISGKGICQGNYTDIHATIITKGDIIKKDEDEYFNITDFYVDFDIGKASVELSDLFGGNPELGQAMNSFLNDNWKTIVKEIEPVLEDKIANLFKKFCNKLYHNIPIKKFLPE